MPIAFTERFVRQYEKLPSVLRRKVDKAVRLLDSDFRHPGLRSHPVSSAPGVFEAYADDRYRLTFERRAYILVLRNVDTTMSACGARETWVGEVLIPSGHNPPPRPRKADHSGFRCRLTADA